MTECNNFDIIGVFISDYGLTGESIAIQIFSYLDFSSLTKGLSVCETWNQFLTKDRTLWLKMLGKTRPSLEYLSHELSNGADDEQKVWQEFFNSLKTKENIKFDKISMLFKKIMTMFVIIQVWGDENSYQVEGYYLPENFENNFGQNIIVEIGYEFDSFFEMIHSKLSAIEFAKAGKEELEYDFSMLFDGYEYELIETFERHFQAYDDDIRKIQSELLQRIKLEIVNSAM